MAKPTLLAAQHEPKSIITRPHLLNTRRLAPGSVAWFRESEKRHGIGGSDAGQQVGGSSLEASVGLMRDYQSADKSSASCVLSVVSGLAVGAVDADG